MRNGLFWSIRSRSADTSYIANVMIYCSRKMVKSKVMPPITLTTSLHSQHFSGSFHTLEAINLSLFSVLQKVGTKNSPPSPPIFDLFPTFTQSNSGKHFQCMERPTEKLANLLCLDCYVKKQKQKKILNSHLI